MLPSKLFKKYLSRFDELITQGEEIKKNVRIVPQKINRSFVMGYRETIKEPYKLIDYSEFNKWKTSCFSLLDAVIPLNSMHRQFILNPKKYSSINSEFETLLSFIKAIKEDFQEGFLDDLKLQIESEIASDYMGQAEQLLSEGRYTPAAVLCGAVLEKELKTLCTQQNPAIPIVTDKGKLKTLGTLIEDLKNVGVYNELKAKQLRAWADIRNAAAHGNFNDFQSEDVESMLKGVKDFFANYMY